MRLVIGQATCNSYTVIFQPVRTESLRWFGYTFSGKSFCGLNKLRCLLPDIRVLHVFHIRAYLHCTLSLAAQCIVIGPVCLFVRLRVCVCVFVGLLP